MSRLSVRAQLALWNVAVVAVALALFGIALRFGVERTLRAGLDRDLTEQIRQIPPPPGERGPDPNDPNGFRPQGPDQQGQHGEQGQHGHQDPPFPQGEGRRDDPRFENGFRPPRPPRDGRFGGPVRVMHMDEEHPGDVSHMWGPEAYSNAGVRRALQQAGQTILTTERRPDNTELRAASEARMMPNGEQVILQVAGSYEPIRFAVAGVTATLLYLLIPALLITGLGGIFLTGRALRPIDHLGAALKRVQAQDLTTARLPDAGSDEFGRLTAILNDLLARLDSAFTRERRFAADASHELRTPLATIRASSSLALEQGDSFTTEQYRSVLSRIDAAAERASRLVQDLLFLARAGTLPVRPDSVPLANLLARARDEALTTRLGQPTAKVTVSLVPEDLVLTTDGDHLQRLISNLIDNALRHTPETGKVEIRARQSASGTEIVVADNGEGIAAEHLSHLFEPFYRADAARSRKRGGAGLGLALCRAIAEALGGTIRLESVLGAGTRVFVQLPARWKEEKSSV